MYSLFYILSLLTVYFFFNNFLLMFETSISSTKDVSFEGKSNVPIAANFPSVFEKEMHEFDEFKKNAPMEICEKLDVLDQYRSTLNKIFCALIRDTGYLFCIQMMIKNDDPILKRFPAASIQAMKGFIGDLDTGDSLAIDDSHSVEIPLHDTIPVKYDVPVPQIRVSIFKLTEYIAKNKLESLMITYYPELCERDKYYINCLRMFRKTCLEKIDDYKRLVYQNSDYFSNLRKADQEYQKRINELDTNYKLMVQSYKQEREFHVQKQSKALNEYRASKELHVIALANERLKSEAIINRNTRQSLEDRANRLQQLEKMQQLYERTVQKDIKRCKVLQKTRYKREMAVVNMIEKYDRDYGAEFNRWEKLNDQYRQLIEKSARIDREMKKKITEYFPIFVLIALRNKRLIKLRQNHCAKTIQKWWKHIMERKRLQAESLTRSEAKHTRRRHSKKSKYVPSSPQSAASARESRTTLHPRNTKRVRVIVPVKLLKKSARSILGYGDEKLDDVDPFQPKSPDALHPDIGKELISIADHLKPRLERRKKSKPKIKSLKAAKAAKKSEMESSNII